MLPLRWLPEAVAAGDYCPPEPPTRPAAWVAELRRQVEMLRDQLAQVCAA